MQEMKPEEAAELLRLAPALVCTATLDGRFRSLGAHWEVILGIPSEEMIGRP
ncbi:MAG: PAS domain-containing protein, partial [Flavobacteriales bacterium]